MADSSRPCKTQFRYSFEADVSLLREGITVNPFSKKNGEGWQEIATNLSKVTKHFPSSLSARTVRDRTNLLLERFKKEQRENEASSGIVEKPTEKDLLLEELLQLREETQKNGHKPQVPGEKNQERELGQLIKRLLKDQAMENMYSAPVVVHHGEEEWEETSAMVENQVATDIHNSSPSPELRRGKKRCADEEDMVGIFKLKEKRKLLELEYQKKKDEADRLDRQRERERLEEKDRLDREERRMEMERQRMREEFDREERRREAQRQRERDEQDREERRQMMQVLITLINKK